MTAILSARGRWDLAGFISDLKFGPLHAERHAPAVEDQSDCPDESLCQLDLPLEVGRSRTEARSSN